jgi:hypothetical protein
MTSGTTHRMAGTLPPQATGFVGRQAEIAHVGAALTQSRLVTIVGTGGVGKTRVAVRVAAQTTGRYPDGVRLVELSAVRDPLLLASTLAAGLGLPAEDTRSYRSTTRSAVRTPTCGRRSTTRSACAATTAPRSRSRPR